MQRTQEIVVGSDGNELPIDSLAITYGYTGSLLTTETVVYGGKTYVQTHTYTGSNLTASSAWVAQ